MKIEIIWKNKEFEIEFMKSINWNFIRKKHWETPLENINFLEFYLYINKTLFKQIKIENVMKKLFEIL